MAIKFQWKIGSLFAQIDDRTIADHIVDLPLASVFMAKYR